METTQPGVDTESHFESLYEQGAFEPTKPEETPPESSQAAQPAEQPQQEAPEEAEDAPAYSNLHEFAQAHKLDVETLNALPVTVKIDGQERQVPLQDVLKSYQLEGHVNNKSIELSNQRTQFEAERTAARTLWQQQLQQGQQVAQGALQVLAQDFQQAISQTADPNERMRIEFEFGKKFNAIQGHATNLRQQQQALEAEQQTEFQRLQDSERSKLLDAKPEWRDAAKFSAADAAMTQAAIKAGLSQAELQQLGDAMKSNHKFALLMDMAAQFAQLQAKAPEVAKKVRSAPPVAKPGVRSNTSQSDAARSAAIERFNKNPRDEDAQAAVFEYLVG